MGKYGDGWCNTKVENGEELGQNDQMKLDEDHVGLAEI